MDRHFSITLLALALVTICVYGSTANYGYVYEDHNADYLVAPRVGTPWPSLRSLIQPGTRGNSVWAFELPARVFGPSPRHFHLENLALHLLSGLLLAGLARPIVGTVGALVAVGVFWLHPMQVESVAYISSRPELVMALGVLLTLRCVQARSAVIGILGTWIVGLLTLSTKEAAVSLLWLLPLFCWWTRVPWERGWLPIVLSWKALILSAAATSNVPGALWRWISGPDYPRHVAQQTAAAWRLLALVIWPVGFTVDHHFSAISWALGVLALLATLGLVVALWLARHVYPSVVFACAWVLLALLPRIVLPSNAGLTEFLTEHHFLVPMIGLSLAVGAACREEGVCAC